jgi:hypothetical protein
MTSETIDLPDDVMAQAAQDFFAAEWASAMEEAGLSFAAGTEITEVCPTQDADKLLELVRPYVARLVHAWGRGVGEMFHLMDIPEHEWAEPLYYILMSCRGHGVGLEDDHGDHIDIAESRLGKAIDPSPFDSEFSEFSDLAYEVVEAEARRRPRPRRRIPARRSGPGGRPDAERGSAQGYRRRRPLLPRWRV